MKITGKIKTLTIASLSAVALAAPIAYAQSTATPQNDKQVTRGERHGGHRKGGGDQERGEGWGRGGERGERGGMDGMMFRGINLTDEQKAKMQSISQSFRERTQSLHQALRANRQELRQASEGNTFNESLATQKLTESAGLQAKLMGEEFRMRQEMLSVLTAEQKTQLEQKRAEFKAKRGERGEQKN